MAERNQRPAIVITSLIGIIILVIVAGILWFGAQWFVKLPGPKPFEPSPRPNQGTAMEKITLKTKDGLNIVGSYWRPSMESTRGALLLHMMPLTKESWNDFAPRLVEIGYHVLAIDLRGHGESGGGPNGHKSFSDAEHQASIQDVEAGVQFLVEKGVRNQELVLIGASIGANLSLWYLTDHSELKHAVLLSPGFNYRGIATEPLMAKLRSGQRVLLVGSDDDPQSDGNVMRTLAGKAPAGVNGEVLVYKAAGHGTNMFAPSKVEGRDLVQEILNWLK